MPVTVGRVLQKPVPLELRVIGTVEPSSTVAIRAQVTGELTSVTFKEGDDVREGQLLFSLDQRPLEAALKQAEANLQRDTAQAANAAAQAKRTEELAARGIATREQLDTSLTNVNALDATLSADGASRSLTTLSTRQPARSASKVRSPTPTTGYGQASS